MLWPIDVRVAAKLLLLQRGFGDLRSREGSARDRMEEGVGMNRNGQVVLLLSPAVEAQVPDTAVDAHVIGNCAPKMTADDAI